MSEIEKLIQKLCPDGVEFRKLGEIAKLEYGFTDKACSIGDARFIRITDIDDNGQLKQDDVKYITLSEQNQKYLLKEGDLLMARTGATYGKTLYVPDSSPAVFASFLIKITFDNNYVLNRYYWHFAKSGFYWEQAKRLVTTGGQPQFNGNALKQVEIPVPPLAVQGAIVRILDGFTELTVELTAELTARRRQYEYYRDALLTPPTSAPLVALGDFVAGVEASADAKAGLTFVGADGDAVRCAVGAPFSGRVVRVREVAAGGELVASTSYLAVATAAALRAGNLDLDAIDADPTERLQSLTIPIPPLATQERIVENLQPDALDALCQRHNLAELAAPQKEALRNLLAAQLIRFCHAPQLLDDADEPDNLRSNPDFLLLADGPATEPQTLRKLLRDAVADAFGEVNAIWAEEAPDGCEVKKLKDVADTFTGLTYKPTDRAATGTLVLRSSNIKDNRLAFDDNVFVQMENIPARAIAHENDILICVRNGSRALIGKSAFIPKTDMPMAFGAFMTVLRARPQEIDPRYLYYLWNTNSVQRMVRGDDAMPINQITSKEFSKVTIPVPPLALQRRIVSILDRFDALCGDLTSGLPAEIAARQKQYEYYRDKLLTFERLEG